MDNFYTEDQNLQRIIEERLSPEFFKWADKELSDFGALCAGDIDRRAVHTDREGQPQLIRYDKMGNDVSHVWLNEGYQKTVQETYNTGIVGYVHKNIPELGHKGNYVYSYAQNYLLAHAEPGFDCPVALTMATAYLIDHYASESLKETFLPHVLATGDVDLYEGATFLTERQGGSDVGANDVEAVNEGEYYRIYGEKYFASNAGACGVAMVLARLDGAPEGTKGLSLFLVPWEENRADNRLRIRRLKDKLGVRAVPSAEIELTGAKGYLVGEENQGFYYMIEALNLSRVSNAISSLGIMRRAYVEARDYAKSRESFGNTLIHYPMIQETLSILAAKQEIEMNAVFDMITLMDKVMGTGLKAEASDKERILFRLYVAILKVETAKQAIHFSHEAIEMHGGNGYIEDFVTPRLLRDAQVLTVWEGTENILALEVLRLIKKHKVEQIFAEEMRGRLSAVQAQAGGEKESSANVTSWAEFMESRISDLIERIEAVRTLSEDKQTYYGKKIAKQFTDILESVTAVEAFTKNNKRQQAISDVFLHHLWNEDEFQENPVVLKHFDIIV
ncbi:acyl-CoA dehydrogenase [Lentibacillus kapialis]|uniref:Acyl-CoA dehydrogenase n=2 Tax=Lentibacillus kapialis TaxID=340214 RepID=A0A917PXA1_9BACI|nr:acyl-CoA dehydrogenase [Lentibacillus kapialis]